MKYHAARGRPVEQNSLSMGMRQHAKVVPTSDGLEKRFILRKKVDFSDMPTLYRSAQLFIYPSIAEGFGIPIIEALNSSIPVITGTAQCLREAGGPDSAYIDPFNAEQMGADILDILHNNSRRERMISNGLEYVERFRDARVAEEWMKNYNDLKK